MKGRKNFLTQLRELFGNSSRQSFLQKLQNFFSDSAKKPQRINKEIIKHKSELEETQLVIIDINGTDAWRNHVERLKDVSVLAEGISNSEILLRNSNMAPFAKSVTTSLVDIPAYVNKHFKEPMDINDDTSEEVARQTGKLVKNYIWDLLRGCHSGIKHSQGPEKSFYESFYERLEQYLSSIGVCRKNIKVGMDIRDNAKWFETPFIRESSVTSQIGTIDEIEVSPHFIPYRDEDGAQDELILKGVCIAFGEARKKG